jgi:hypothetical protein
MINDIFDDEFTAIEAHCIKQHQRSIMKTIAVTFLWIKNPHEETSIFSLHSSGE